MPGQTTKIKRKIVSLSKISINSKPLQDSDDNKDFGNKKPTEKNIKEIEMKIARQAYLQQTNPLQTMESFFARFLSPTLLRVLLRKIK